MAKGLGENTYNMKGNLVGRNYDIAFIIIMKVIK